MGVPLHKGVDGRRELVWLADIPQADLIVITTREKQTHVVRVPVEPIAFSSVTQESQVRLDFVSARLSTMFEIVKNVNFTAHSLGRDDLVRLGHSASAVNLSHVIDLDLNLDPFLPRFFFFLVISCRLASHNLSDSRLFSALDGLVKLTCVL